MDQYVNVPNLSFNTPDKGRGQLESGRLNIGRVGPNKNLEAWPSNMICCRKSCTLNVLKFRTISIHMYNGSNIKQRINNRTTASERTAAQATRGA